jgi:hypothetical protein
MLRAGKDEKNKMSLGAFRESARAIDADGAALRGKQWISPTAAAMSQGD